MATALQSSLMSNMHSQPPQHQHPQGTFVMGTVQPVPAPLAANFYTQQAPAYVTVAHGPPSVTSQAEQMLGNALRIGNSVGVAASNLLTSSINQAFTGKVGVVTTARGKVDYGECSCL